MKSMKPPCPPPHTARQPPLGHMAMQPPPHEMLALQLPSSATHEQSSKVAAKGVLRKSSPVRRLAAKSLIIFSFRCEVSSPQSSCIGRCPNLAPTSKYQKWVA